MGGHLALPAQVAGVFSIVPALWLLPREELGGVAVAKRPAHRLQTLSVAPGQREVHDQGNEYHEKPDDERYDQHEKRAGHRPLGPCLRYHDAGFGQ